MSLENEKLYPLTQKDVDKFLKAEKVDVKTKTSVKDFLDAVKANIPYESDETLDAKAEIINAASNYMREHGAEEYCDLWNKYTRKISFAFLRATKWNAAKAYKLYEKLFHIIHNIDSKQNLDELINKK